AAVPLLWPGPGAILTPGPSCRRGWPDLRAGTVSFPPPTSHPPRTGSPPKKHAPPCRVPRPGCHYPVSACHRSGGPSFREKGTEMASQAEIAKHRARIVGVLASPACADIRFQLAGVQIVRLHYNYLAALVQADKVLVDFGGPRYRLQEQDDPA